MCAHYQRVLTYFPVHDVICAKKWLFKRRLTWQSHGYTNAEPFRVKRRRNIERVCVGLEESCISPVRSIQSPVCHTFQSLDNLSSENVHTINTLRIEGVIWPKKTTTQENAIMGEDAREKKRGRRSLTEMKSVAKRRKNALTIRSF